jgi:hypothetical protein
LEANFKFGSNFNKGLILELGSMFTFEHTMSWCMTQHGLNTIIWWSTCQSCYNHCCHKKWCLGFCNCPMVLCMNCFIIYYIGNACDIESFAILFHIILCNFLVKYYNYSDMILNLVLSYFILYYVIPMTKISKNWFINGFL